MEVDTAQSTTNGDVAPSQPQSQPMTASNSTSSNPTTEVASGVAAMYGTRSRRTTTARPNYAEDKEVDLDFEVASTTKDTKGRKSTKGAVDLGPTDRMDFVPTPPPAQNGTPVEDLIISMPSHYPTPIPGTSTFSSKPPSSKKRKTASQSNPTENFRPYQPPTQAALQPPPPNTRRASHAAEVISGIRETNMLSFDGCNYRVKDKKLVADDGTVLGVNDHVYMVCEPPGEPYYMGRIMEFVHVNSDPAQAVEALRLNWYYRPKDIGRKVNDTRQVFASMHSDVSPITALRGICQIKHRCEVDKLEDVRETKDCFWYEKLYDRYIHRYYDVIPTSAVINVPANVKKVLDERWRYIVVEPGRGKELTSAIKSCKKCSRYCASNDSVDCAVCKNTYHMSCVSPPLQKKPSRGFAWACGPCSKAQERKLEARNTPNVNDAMVDTEEDELVEDEDSPMEDCAPLSPVKLNEPDISHATGHSKQTNQPSPWLFRYLGIHCKVEDVLDSDDRIYPRAGSRLGARHQANVPAWPGRPIEYVKPIEIKRKYLKSKKNSALAKETLAALEADKIERENRPKWVMDEPMGYVNRGEDLDDRDPNITANLQFKMPDSTIPERGMDDTQSRATPDREQVIYDYMGRARPMAKMMGLPELSTNFMDITLHVLQANNYDVEKALRELPSVKKEEFKEPDLSPAELKKFEDGVTKYGSEWHSIKKHVKSVSAADIVRFYYTWKKTDRGKQVWGKFHGRKGKKEAKKSESASAGKLQDDVADEYDDSAFDNNKAFEKKRRFQCKFCLTQSSRQWRRAPNTAAGTMIPENPSGKTGKEKGEKLMVALCRRCAELWRRYGIQWEDIDEYQKKLAASGGRVWKRKIDEETLKELVAANETLYALNGAPPMAPISGNGTPAPAPVSLQTGPEPPKKKVKGASEHEPIEQPTENGNIAIPPPLKKKIEKPLPPPPPPPEPPKARVLPCAICDQLEPTGDQLLACMVCRLSVHRSCYGVVGENRSPGKWACDTCSNDKNPQVSIQYKCMLCPHEYTSYDFVEPPKAMPKKKNEKDREKDRLEREKAVKDAEHFHNRQVELNRPINPREPLKRTANNNWVHVLCAVFTPEVKFGNAKALELSEGIPSIQSAKYEEICKACKRKGGACVSCRSCHAPVHVECAHQNGYTIGFDVTPVKGSRRDHTNVVSINGETGTMTAAIWCKEHAPTKTIVHEIQAPVEGTELTAMQLFVQNFKQADLTLTGTVRKATLIYQSSKVLNPTQVAAPPNRRTSTTTVGRGSVSQVKHEDTSREAQVIKPVDLEKACITCGIDISPRWWPHAPPATHGEVKTEKPPVTNGEPHADEPSLTNGNGGQESVDNNAGNIALAVAALHQNTTQPEPLLAPQPVVTEFQCHKCHCRKAQKEPTPAPVSPPKEPTPPPPVEAPSAIVPLPESGVAPPPASQYQWSQAPPYVSNAPFNSWSAAVPNLHGHPVNHLNGGRSPRLGNGGPQHFNGPPPLGQPARSHSPLQNGHIAHGPNGYPPSPPRRRESLSSGINLQNGSQYGTYISARPPPPHHLMNGGPPPRAPEHPFQQGTQRQPDAHYSTFEATPSHEFTQTFGQSPSRTREPNMHSRNLSDPPNNGGPPQERRVNGGASASPSLRNLLS
ncbi:hypothetical protein B0O99DRAFT_519614 [Bisporella sp. PMI_857]|nr:hypothetical protein B0O99DRAFT_519614 [Bisporella sp. PMI_857]